MNVVNHLDQCIIALLLIMGIHGCDYNKWTGFDHMPVKEWSDHPQHHALVLSARPEAEGKEGQ